MTKQNQPGKIHGQEYMLQASALFRLLRPVRAYLITCIILSVVGAAAGLCPYIAIAEIARRLLEPGSAQSAGIGSWLALGITGACLRLLLLLASSRVGHYADARILHDIRKQIVKHLGAVPLGWFRATGSATVKKAMTHDLEEMHQLIAHALGEMTGAVTAMLLGSAYLIATEWHMALVSIGVLLLMGLFFKRAMRSVTIHINRLLAAERNISTASIEYADGITVVKTFGVGGRILDRFAAAVREHTGAMGAWVAETRYSSAMSRLLASEMTLLGAVLIAGLSMVYGGILTMADLLPAIVVGTGLPTALTPAIQGSQGLRKGRLSATNIDRLLQLAPLPEPVRPQLPENFRIELDHVSFSYDGVNNVLNDISVVCEPGTVTALVGPSGAGKSTIAALLPRFQDVTSGAIRIGGVDIRDIPGPQLLQAMSLVFQDVVLLRDTIKENIRIGKPAATDEEIYAATQAAQIHQVILQLPDGYDTVLGNANTGLSGGERQRLTIARAILSDAPVVVLDEATAALDPDSETSVQQAMSVLASGKTVIVIAHRLYSIRHADQIIVLDKGHIAEAGTQQQLIDRDGLYSRMWYAQQEGTPS